MIKLIGQHEINQIRWLSVDAKTVIVFSLGNMLDFIIKEKLCNFQKHDIYLPIIEFEEVECIKNVLGNEINLQI